MNYKILAFFGLLFPFITLAQEEYWSRLEINGNVSELGITPNEEIWVATMTGNVYHTNKIGDLWHVGSGGHFGGKYGGSGATFERISCLSKDTMMISGFIQENGKQDFVFWTGNHGKNWEKVKFGKSSWIDAAYNNDYGKIWMSGNSQLIYFSQDYGKSWDSFDKVEKTGNLRFSAIHFDKDDKTGLFGSFWNVIYLTKDNCQTWERLKTPLDQNKYQRISNNERPDIRKIRIVDNYIVVNQQGKIFVTKRDVIDWKLLSNVEDFESKDDGGFYFVNKDLSISITDSLLHEVWKSDQKIESYPRALAVKNGKVFILTSSRLYRINADSFQSSELFTEDFPIEEPYLKVEMNNSRYGFEDNDVYVFDQEKNGWRRWCLLDFSVGHATIFEGEILLSDKNLTEHYKFEPNEKLITEFRLPKNLFQDLKINTVIFEKGSQGCFHSDKLNKIYRRSEEMFVFDYYKSNFGYLPKIDSLLNSSTVDKIIEIINESKESIVKLADLKLTKSDIKSFKSFIDEIQSERALMGKFYSNEEPYAFPDDNPDFNFYKNIADTLLLLSDNEIDRIFWDSYGNWSTTTDWHSISFEFDNGKTLLISNKDDYPNFMYTPWIVEYDGLLFRVNSIALGQYINEITKDQFIVDHYHEKNFAIFQIAKYYYLKKLKGE